MFGRTKENPAVKAANGTLFDKDGNPKPAILRAVERALDVQRPFVLSNLERLRKRHPEASPAELARLLERDYLRATTVAGAAVGATATVPAVGTLASSDSPPRRPSGSSRRRRSSRSPSRNCTASAPRTPNVHARWSWRSSWGRRARR